MRISQCCKVQRKNNIWRVPVYIDNCLRTFRRLRKCSTLSARHLLSSQDSTWVSSSSLSSLATLGNIPSISMDSQLKLWVLTSIWRTTVLRQIPSWITQPIEIAWSYAVKLELRVDLIWVFATVRRITTLSTWSMVSLLVKIARISVDSLSRCMKVYLFTRKNKSFW